MTKIHKLQSELEYSKRHLEFLKKQISAYEKNIQKLNQEIEDASKKNFSPLEVEFRGLVAEHKSKIDALVAIAEEKLEEAISLSQATGVPFHSRLLYWNYNKYYPYVPSSLEKFSDLGENLIEEIYEDDYHNEPLFLNSRFKNNRYGWAWTSSTWSCTDSPTEREI